MNEDLVRTAKRFVEIAQAHDWPIITTLTESDIAGFCWVMDKAGFNLSRITIGVLRGHNDDRNGGGSYVINDVCRCIAEVDSAELGANCFPTGWLNDLLKQVLASDPEDRVAVVVREMERSIPLWPIQLTSEGDYLVEVRRTKQAGKYGYLVDHCRDTHRLGPVLGIHKTCGGQIERHITTEHRAALFCRMCLLRHTIPIGIATYGDLRKEYDRRLRMS